MAWTNLVFTIGQIFTAAQANALNENTKVTRISHKGPTAPALPTAGVHWIDDSQTIWIDKIYTGSQWMPTLFYDTVEAEGGFAPLASDWGSIPMVTQDEERTDYAGPPTALKNVLLNAQMAYWQRGTSFGHGGNLSKYTADRWQIQRRGTMVVESTRSTDSPIDSPSDFSYQIKVITAQPTMNSGDVLSLYQSVEGTTLNRFQFGRPTARRTRLSGWFWSNVTGRMSLAVSNDASSPGIISNVGWIDIYVASTWLFKDFGFVRPMSGSWRQGNLAAANVLFTIAASSTYLTATPSAWVYNGPAVRTASGQTNGVAATNTIFRFADLQWESGGMATPIEVLPPALERMLLARYYWKTFPTGVPPSYNRGANGAFMVVADDQGRPRGHMRFSPMRVPPTLEFWSITENTDLWYNVTQAQGGPTPIVYAISEESLALNATANATYAFNWQAIHITADAEL